MLKRHATTKALVEQSFAQFKSQPAYTCLGRSVTYAELDKLSMQFAKYLHHSMGLRPGDKLAVQLPNILQFPVVMYGAIRAGVVMVTLNPLYTEREIEQQLNDSGAKALVVLENIALNASNVVEKTQVKQVIVAQVADLHPLPKRLLIHFVLHYIKKKVRPFHFKHAVSFRECLQPSLPDLPDIRVAPEDTVVLQYTGGTTGIAKGAMLSQSNLASNVWQLLSHLPEAVERGDEIFLACLPMYHIYALNLHGLCALSGGCHNVLVPNPREFASIVKAMQQYPVDVFVGVNTLFNALCRQEDFQQLDFSALKLTAAGGMALTQDAAESWRKITGCRICEGYGLTETSPVVTGNQPKKIRPGTIGSLLPETEAKVVDSEDRELPPGEAGELCVRGPQVMKGYWRRDDETNKVLSEDGWLRTGDIAIIDADGYLKIVDRKKDMILVSGFNVYPNEIEDVVSQMPEVLEAAAIGVEDPTCGEKVKMFIVPADDSLSEKQVRDFCKGKLTPYKIPSYVEFRDSLPKSTVGKILRKELRNM